MPQTAAVHSVTFARCALWRFAHRQQLIFDMSLKTSNFQSCPSGVDAGSRPKESLGVFLRRLLHRKILASLGEDAGGDAESSENEDGKIMPGFKVGGQFTIQVLFLSRFFVLSWQIKAKIPTPRKRQAALAPLTDESPKSLLKQMLTVLGFYRKISFSWPWSCLA